MVVTSTVLAAGLATQLGLAAGITSLGASFFTAGLVGGAAGYFAGGALNKKMFGSSDIGAPLSALKDWMTPDIPEVSTPEAPIVQGQEGIRRGEQKRLSDRRQTAYLLTKGQSRAEDMTLGGYRSTLG